MAEIAYDIFGTRIATNYWRMVCSAKHGFPRWLRDSVVCSTILLVASLVGRPVLGAEPRVLANRNDDTVVAEAPSNRTRHTTINSCLPDTVLGSNKHTGPGNRATLLSQLFYRHQRSRTSNFPAPKEVVGDPQTRAYQSRAGYTRYIGRDGTIYGPKIAVDPLGNVYVAGAVGTAPPDSQDPLQIPSSDLFVTRLDPAGNEVFTISFGGSDTETLGAIATDAQGNLYLVGNTRSSDFPLFNPLQNQMGGERTHGDAFVARVAPNGGLTYSTYLGGDLGETANAVAVDVQGNIYLAGLTSSTDFPVTEGALKSQADPRTSFATPTDGFVTKISADGQRLMFSTRLGGRQYLCIGGSRCVNATGVDNVRAMAVDASGNVYVGGHTNTLDFPTTPGAFQTESQAEFMSSDGFVSKLNSTGRSLIFSTYLGGGGPFGTGQDSISSLAIDAAGNAFVAGTTWSAEFPTTPGALQPKYDPLETGNSIPAAFVTKINAAGNGLLYSTFLSGGESRFFSTESASGLALDSAGRVYVAGESNAAIFPQTQGAFGRGGDFFTVLSADGAKAEFSTLLPSGFAGAGVALGSTGDVHLVGLSGYVSRIAGNEFTLPVLLGVANAAGGSVTGWVSPSELIAIFGNGIGPNDPVNLQLDPQGNVSKSLAGIEVRINGEPVPLLYAQRDQINAVAPYWVYGSPAATLQIRRDGAVLSESKLGVRYVDPGILRNFASGIGFSGDYPAAALNQDQTVNTEANPARYGSIVTIYATGFGTTDPPLRDGEISLDRLPAPIQAVSVESGLEILEVLYAGQAPGLVAGVMQVNFRLPRAGSDVEGEFGLLLRVGQAVRGFSLFAAP